MTQSEIFQSAMEILSSLPDGPGLMLLVLACREHEPMDLAGLANLVALPKETAREHVQELVNHGYVTFVRGLPSLHFGAEAAFSGLMARLTGLRVTEKSR
jgi:DNA-binding IclR family transcriptional regulator